MSENDPNTHELEVHETPEHLKYPGKIDEPLPFDKGTEFSVDLMANLLSELGRLKGFEYECIIDKTTDIFRARAYVGDINVDEIFIDKDDTAASCKALLALRFELEKLHLLT